VLGYSSPWAGVATFDAIRHFAWGIGDANPLWLDEDYGKLSAWQGTIAPPSFLYASINTAIAPDLDSTRLSYSRVKWTWFDVVRLGSSITSTGHSHKPHLKAKNSSQQTLIEFTTSSGLLLAQLENDCLELEEHDQTQTVGTRYTDQEIEEIELVILSESRRGNTARYSETTIHGDQLGPLTKGPLSIVDLIAWSAGCTGYDIDVHSNSPTGLDASTATAPQVTAWICHLLTDWMGDDSFLHSLDIEIFSVPRLGSTTVITGVVDRESASHDEKYTKINVVAKSQDGSMVATGFALVLQPKSDQSKICLPLEK